MRIWDWCGIGTISQQRNDMRFLLLHGTNLQAGTPSDSWDFHLASRLFSTLEDWKDSRNTSVHSTHIITRPTAWSKALHFTWPTYSGLENRESSEKPRIFKKDVRGENTEMSNHGESLQQCSNCWKNGHYAAMRSFRTGSRHDPVDERGQRSDG